VAGNILRYCVTSEDGTQEVVTLDCDSLAGQFTCQNTNAQTAFYDCREPQQPTLPAPVLPAANGRLLFSSYYISGSPCGEVIGELPGMNWSAGSLIQDSNHDGYMEFNGSQAAADVAFRFTFLDHQCPGETVARSNAAMYGGKEQIRAMTAAAKSFLQCNWWDAAANNGQGGEISVSNPGCNFRAQKSAPNNVGEVTWSGQGNMSNFH
jgi:hypothetical protein